MYNIIIAKNIKQIKMQFHSCVCNTCIRINVKILT